MATFVTAYNDVWKWFQFDWGTPRILYWQDFNPLDQWDGSADNCTVYQPTSNFDLSWFQVWHEVVCWAFKLYRYWPWDALVQRRTLKFLRSSDWVSWAGSWLVQTLVEERDAISSWQDSYARWAWYFWIDFDEIWDWYDYYKINVSSSDWLINIDSPVFTVSNLNIDSVRHKAWCMWVDGANLHFVDGIRYNEWYTHTIAYDWNYNSYVWTDYAGMIWLDPNTTRRIYYVDEYWYKRRTYQASNWYGYPWWRSVSTDYAGKIWVAQSWNADTGYWHLCFVSSAWDVLRILNWPPWWVA